MLTYFNDHIIKNFLAKSLLVILLVSSLLSPVTSFAAEPSDKKGITNITSPQSDKAAKDVAEPWFDKDMRWDAGWGAFNSDISETANGVCYLSKDQVAQLKNLTTVTKKDYNNIIENQDRPEKWASMYQKSLAERIKTGKAPSLQDAAPSAAGSKPWKLNQGRVSAWLNKAKDQGRAHTVNGRPSKVRTPNDFIKAVNKIPQISACNLGVKSLEDVLGALAPKLGDIIKDPASVPIRFFMFLIAFPSYIVYNFLGKPVLQTLFINPHSERGDTIMDVQKAEESSTEAMNPNQMTANCKGPATGIQSCSYTQELKCQRSRSGDIVEANSNKLGFSCQRALSPAQSEQAIWIKIAKSLRSVLSGLFSLIIIGSALIYLFRHNTKSAYNVKIILPKVLGAVVLCALAPYLIGAGITVSNWMSQSLLVTLNGGAINNQIVSTIIDVREVGYSQDGFTQMLNANLIGAILPALILFALAILIILLGSMVIIKQLALIGLIVATPLAAVAYIFPNGKTQGLFGMWARGLLAILAMPVIASFIMMIGMTISTGIANPNSVVQTILSALMILVTLYAILKAGLKLKGYVTGDSSSVARKVTSKGIGLTGTAAALGVGLGTGNFALAGTIGSTTGRIANSVGRERQGKSWIPNASGSALSAPQASNTSSSYQQPMIASTLMDMGRANYYNQGNPKAKKKAEEERAAKQSENRRLNPAPEDIVESTPNTSRVDIPELPDPTPAPIPVANTNSSVDPSFWSQNANEQNKWDEVRQEESTQREKINSNQGTEALLDAMNMNAANINIENVSIDNMGSAIPTNIPALANRGDVSEFKLNSDSFERQSSPLVSTPVNASQMKTTSSPGLKSKIKKQVPDMAKNSPSVSTPTSRPFSSYSGSSTGTNKTNSTPKIITTTNIPSTGNFEAQATPDHIAEATNIPTTNWANQDLESAKIIEDASKLQQETAQEAIIKTDKSSFQSPSEEIFNDIADTLSNL